MGWFPRRSRATSLRSADEVRALTASAWADPPSNGTQWFAPSGSYVNDRTAMQHLAVYSCVRLLADSIAALPVDVYRKKDNVRISVATPPVIEDPDPDINGFEYVQQVVTSLALRGNSYEYISRLDDMERPINRIPVHPDYVQVTRNNGDGLPDYRISGEQIPRSRMIHIRRLTLPGRPVGLSPIEQARQAIGLGLAAEAYGARWFGDSANPSAVLETAANLPSDEALKVMKSWVDSHGGRRHPAVLSGGLTYRPITITPEESQFLGTRDFQRSEIAMFFGIPPHMIGDTSKATSWGSGIESMSRGFVQYSLLPWLRCIEATYSRALLPRGQYMRFNVDGMLRGDTPSRYAAYTQARQASWLNVNEIRALEDLPPVPGGDEYIQPLNFGPLGADPAAAAAPPLGGTP